MKTITFIAALLLWEPSSSKDPFGPEERPVASISTED